MNLRLESSSLKRALHQAVRVVATLVVVALALYAGYRLWEYYQLAPWTPDGRVRADIVQVAPDVSGLVTDVFVADDQPVERGQPLFQIDRARYALALRDAQAGVLARRATLEQARREAGRNDRLGELVSKEDREETRSAVALAEAALAQAEADRDLAALDLARTRVVAPTDGSLSDLGLRVGDYVTAGIPVLALIDASSYRVEGYFEETKLQRIAVGQPVRVRLMGERRVLTGRVESIAAGIEDRDRNAGANLLPNVNPTFSWVRLAQRVPVRVRLDDPPAQAAGLVAGRTATVIVLPWPDGDGRP
ncbi:RND family efflux transporter, MFP subunit [Thioflavicoccus mobilis 8321]|uniref:RND family efflux transporter, MFP subunit n=1 Tax=Thioflavicoccus mobilis 8321 TaxID=765912 RepID=L0GVL8_9GAMM|nr:efflux RND transporter periplasmic adaptor subunit [Thioflavicoccus mobilis]AGA89344.1 RND family efflux transporter, MFP subunit [Thioflavicoccus mobilis 8321]